MKKWARNLVAIGALFGGSACQAGLITDATASSYGLGGQQSCDTGNVSGTPARCSANVGTSAAASSSATASYGSVTAYIQGGANWPPSEASATATASFTDMLTIFGGTGTGELLIQESNIVFATGSLGTMSQGMFARPATVIESFTFGTPFALALTAFSTGSFDGGQGDSGSLLIEKTIVSLTVEGVGLSNVTYTDVSGTEYSIGVSGGTAAASFSAAPEPDSWVFLSIGVALLWIGWRRTGNATGRDSG